MINFFLIISTTVFLSGAQAETVWQINAAAGCTDNSQFCQNMRNADQVARQQAAERAQQEQRRLNQQHGTSQYHGPTVSRNGEGTPMFGYQRPTR